MSEISKVIESEIADFFAGFGGPGEPDIQSGEAQRLLTERLLSVLALRDRAEPVADPDSCDPDVFERGTSACLVDIPKDAAEIICRGISAATGCKIDWHYVGGRVHIKALYTAPPAPVADDDSEIKWRELALQFDGHRMQAICFLKQILKELPEAEFSSARDFLKSGPLSGEEVLRNRIAALAQPATVVPELKPVGYLFVSDRGEVVYSPTNWHVTGLRLIGQIYGDISTRRAATLAAPGKEG